MTRAAPQQKCFLEWQACLVSDVEEQAREEKLVGERSQELGAYCLQASNLVNTQEDVVMLRALSAYRVVIDYLQPGK